MTFGIIYDKITMERGDVMGALVFSGFLLALEIAICLVFSIIGLFFGHIILFDSIALAILAGALSHNFLGVHPALAVVIGIAVLALMYWVQNTKFGFWIIGGLLSAMWGFIFGFFAYDITKNNIVWFYVVWALGAMLMMGLHINARNKMAIE